MAIWIPTIAQHHGKLFRAFAHGRGRTCYVVAIGAKHVDNTSAVGDNHATILHAQISGITRIVLPAIFKLDNLH
jgi:hypothetical protein